MNRHAVEEEYFHVSLLKGDSNRRSVDRSRSFYNAPRVDFAYESIISANVYPSSTVAVHTVEEVYHHINFEFVLAALHIFALE